MPNRGKTRYGHIFSRGISFGAGRSADTRFDPVWAARRARVMKAAFAAGAAATTEAAPFKETPSTTFGDLVQHKAGLHYGCQQCGPCRHQERPLVAANLRDRERARSALSGTRNRVRKRTCRRQPSLGPVVSRYSLQRTQLLSKPNPAVIVGLLGSERSRLWMFGRPHRSSPKLSRWRRP